MFILLIAALLHPVHETVSEIEWNTKTSRLEVALRIDVLDEQWLRKKLGGQQEVPQWALGYLRQNFRITERPEKNKPDETTYRWIGRKPEGSHVWWYFEIEPPDKKRPTWIEQRVLFDREENYTHRILILEKNRRRSLDLNSQRPKADLDQAKDDTESIPPADR
ncbi:MAG: DUF6702 family protein [Bythopirellula sp.]